MSTFAPQDRDASAELRGVNGIRSSRSRGPTVRDTDHSTARHTPRKLAHDQVETRRLRPRLSRSDARPDQSAASLGARDGDAPRPDDVRPPGSSDQEGERQPEMTDGRNGRSRAAARRSLAISPASRSAGRGAARATGWSIKMRITPHWFHQDNRFWYRNDLAGGAKEFILVDAEHGTRQPAFDHQKLAAGLSKAAGGEAYKADQASV